MAINKEDAEQAFKDAILTQIGIAATISDKIRDKLDEYKERGKQVAADHKDLDDEIRRTIKRAKKEDDEETEETAGE